MRASSLLISIALIVGCLALALIPIGYAQPVTGTTAQYLPLVFKTLSMPNPATNTPIVITVIVTVVVTATPLPTPTASTPPHFLFSAKVDDKVPPVGGTVTTSGELKDTSNNGFNGVTVNVTYAYSEGTGPWCSATTDVDGYWACDGTVLAAMQDKQVILTAQVNVNGQTLSEEMTMTPILIM